MTSTVPSAPADGRADFDFIHGSWSIVNRRLTDPLDPACDTWAEFAATGVAAPVLDGLGNSDHFWAPELPDGGALEGFTLRLFEPETGTWRIWWASTSRPGHLDPPVEGRFTDGVGTFECDDVLGGEKVRVRFLWHSMTGTSATWEQSFSRDSGGTWQRNWVMQFTRADGQVPVVAGRQVAG
jgi:hypothetical protein